MLQNQMLRETGVLCKKSEIRRLVNSCNVHLLSLRSKAWKDDSHLAAVSRNPEEYLFVQ